MPPRASVLELTPVWLTIDQLVYNVHTGTTALPDDAPGSARVTTKEKTTLDLNDDTAWISIDDGKVNAMSLELLHEIADRIDEGASSARSIVIAGRPGILSAGFDLSTLKSGPEAARALLDAGVSLILQMLESPVPILVACTGHAYPMGAFLLLASDVRVGTEGNWKIGLNEVEIGITVPRFALALAKYRLTPSAYARIRTAGMFAPHDAVTAGYLDEVLTTSTLRNRCSALATQMNQLDSVAYQATKARIVAPLVKRIRREPY